MEKLFLSYQNHLPITGSNTCQLFSDFYMDKTNRCKINEYLVEMMSSKRTKSAVISDRLRLEGNLSYKNKRFEEALRCYTKAACWAPVDSELYCLALANRSAVFYMMSRYKECLIDMENCTQKMECPEATKSKLEIRKQKCCDAEKSGSAKDNVDEDSPVLKDGANASFKCASSALDLRSDAENGRHVIANANIETGDVLFVEKAFVFAPVFAGADEDLRFDKCYNCLATAYANVPCKSCAGCVVFCDVTCQTAAWEEFHKWECRGMQSDFWRRIGIGLPAFRMVVRLAREANSPAKTLVTNVDKTANVLPVILVASLVTSYLTAYTDFFNISPTSTDVAIGGSLVSAILQIQSNASLIKDTNLPDDEDASLACGIYPSISMMNHSCWANITIEYDRDVAVVRAAENIPKGSQVFNCYGIHHRLMGRDKRQASCARLYYFKCECRACKM